MDLLGDILDDMDKNVRPGLSKADKMIKQQHEEMKKTVEKEKAIISNYKRKIQDKVANFLKNDKVSTMQFQPMEKIFRSCIIETVEESGSGLICHTFGKEDRYVIVYKNAPSELELEARRYHDFTGHWSKESENDLKKKKEHEALLASSTTTDDGSAETSKTNKKPKMIHVECEAISTNPNRNFGMVSSDLKKDKRTVEETLNDIQQKKRQKTLQQTVDGSN